MKTPRGVKIRSPRAKSRGESRARSPLDFARGERIIALLLLGALWGCAEAPPIPPPDAAPEVQEGHRLFLAKCTLCHSPVQPAEHAAAAWPKLVDKYGLRARLKPEEKAEVLAYVQQYSK